MAKAITLTELRDLTAELGLELVYMVGESKIKFEPVSHDNFTLRKHIAVTKAGELFIGKMYPAQLFPRMERAVKRHRKVKHIADTKATYGRE